MATIDRALAAAPKFVMAHVLKEHLRKGEWSVAALALDFHNARHPRDLLAVQVGHVIDFYRAHARALRDRIARVLPQWSPSTPGFSLVLGMYAFGLEECGDYAWAEDVGRQALDAEPLDCWAHHAVAHVMEMQGRAQDGIGWMAAREPYWSADDNFFTVHNWWHRALCHLDLGQRDDVLRIYDGPIRGSRSVVALPLAGGFRAFGRGEYRECAEGLHAARYIVNQFGGSHAQRDIIDWTLTEAAVRAGLTDLAQALAHERLALKPHSPINQAFLRRARGQP